MCAAALALACGGPAHGARGTPSAALELTSPDGRTRVTLHPGANLTWSVQRDGRELLRPAPLGLIVAGRAPLGEAARVDKVTRRQADTWIEAPLYARRARVRDRYRELAVRLRDGLGAIVRAYDDAVAYRLTIELPGTVEILHERVALRPAGNPTAYLGLEDCTPRPRTTAGPDGSGAAGAPDCFHSSYERPYTILPLDQLSARGDRMAYLPILLDTGATKLLFSEADLRDYPGLWLRAAPDDPGRLDGTFARYPLDEVITGKYPTPRVTRRAGYIARTAGTRTLPWRVVALADHDRDLPAHDVVFRLGGESPRAPFDWVLPGKSTSEWLYNNELYGIPFQAGYNTETYEHYIDFARSFGLQYLFFDAGWSDYRDLSKRTPAIDLPALIQKARASGLRVVLWSTAVALRGKVAAELERLAALGAEGVMVDFLERDDQVMVNFYEELVREAARLRMIVNIHGAFKPTGLERRFPNAVTREALAAFEYNKWEDFITPEHHVLLPFIRGVVGPMDYEPGAMRNAARGKFRAMGSHPMSQGTRMQQAALLVVYDCLYAKLGGNVSDYRQEPEFTRFLASIPTLWRETKVIDARAGKYLVMARQSPGGDWWLAAMTDWEPRELDVPLDFLGPGRFAAELRADGPNAHAFAHDHVVSRREVTGVERLRVTLAPGGGFVARLTRASP